MGEAADEMIYGFACQKCGCVFEDNEEPGYARTCNHCGGKDGDIL